MKINNLYSTFPGLNTEMKERPAIPKSDAVVYDHHANQSLKPRAGSLLEALMRGENTGTVPGSLEDYEDSLKGKLASSMSRLGIELREDETVELSIGPDNLIRVSGLKDPDQAAALEKEMNTANKVSLTGKAPSETVTKNLHDRAFYIHSNYARSAGSFEEAENRASLIDLKYRAAGIVRSQTGEELDFSSLYRTDEGNIAGFPEALSWIFNGEYSLAPSTDEEKQRYSVAISVLDAVNRLLDAGYDSIPDVGSLDTVFRFGRDDLYIRSIDTTA
ncbi:hypothetical protein LJC19_00090 [Oxalobacter sp. OttesenSCG-928-P03]|nr:hypothetical protein [Oxalobacter sp. OttesenSCG-928-P03]